MRRDGQRKELVLTFDSAKCLHHYFYFAHPLYGLMHLRLQTWFPFGVSVCMNGRQWLARQMNAAGIGYVQRENCFDFIEDVEAAQRLANEQLRSGTGRSPECPIAIGIPKPATRYTPTEAARVRIPRGLSRKQEADFLQRDLGEAVAVSVYYCLRNSARQSSI